MCVPKVTPIHCISLQAFIGSISLQAFHCKHFIANISLQTFKRIIFKALKFASGTQLVEYKLGIMLRTRHCSSHFVCPPLNTHQKSKGVSEVGLRTSGSPIAVYVKRTPFTYFHMFPNSCIATSIRLQY